MFNFESMFKGAFGKIDPGMCKLTMNGGIAVKCHDGYKSYNMKKKRLVNISNFGFDADNFFFVIPTNSVKIGDIILVDGKPKCVIAVNDESIKVIDYDSSEIREIIPTRHVFMGATYFYGKIVSLFGDTFKSGKGLGKMMGMAAMMSMFSGKSNPSMPTTAGFDPSMFMMMSMFGGGSRSSNPFEDMFSGMDLDFGVAADEDEDEDITPTKKTKGGE